MKISFWLKKHANWSWSWLGVTAIVINMFSWFFVWWRMPYKLEDIPLHYHSYFGIDLLGPGKDFWYVCIFGFIVAVTHFWWARKVNDVLVSIKILIISNAVQIIILSYLILLTINYFVS